MTRAWDARTLRPLLAAEDFSGVKLDAVLDGSQAKLTSVEPIDAQGRTQIRVNVERSFPKDIRTYSGWAILDPNHHWAIVKYEQQYNWGMFRQSAMYRSDVSDIAFPEQVFREEVSSDGTVLGTFSTIIGKPAPCNLDGAKFTLQAFDLEPPHNQSKARATALLLNAALFGAAGVFFLLLFWRRRRKASLLSDAAARGGDIQ